MTTKIDKLQRQKKLHNNIVTDTFNLETYLTENKVTERTLRRDLHDLAENGELFDNKLSILRKICLGKLTKKAATNKISDVLMLQIVLSGVAQKIEQKIDGNVTENKTVTYNINYSEEEKHAILNAYSRIRDKQGSSQIKPPGLH